MDYYAILGVLPTAEDVVIRAAYKALAQRYHPDRFTGAKEESHRRMAEINEAYATLSDQGKRREYDKSYGAGTQSSNSFFDSDLDSSPPGLDPLDRDWQVALKYYPDLQEIESRLAKIAWRLAYSYRAYLLEIKDFEMRNQLADSIESQFLQTYFGENPQIVDFARTLIFSGKKKAALALNEAVRVLGEKSDSGKIIRSVTREHLKQEDTNTEVGRITSKIKSLPDDSGFQMKVELITLLGGEFKWNGLFSNGCSVTLNSKDYEFASEKDFSLWVYRDIVPSL